MVIAMDYDGTYTEDPELWLPFLKSAKDRGHTVLCVTMRTEDEASEMPSELLDIVQLICTSRQAKLPYLAGKNIEIDVWIDDSPHWIFQDSF